MLSAEEFLAASPAVAPRVLLLLLAGWDPQCPERLSETSRSLFGFEPDATFQAEAMRVRSTPAQIESALRQAGWGPFVRKVQERLHESIEETHA